MVLQFYEPHCFVFLSILLYLFNFKMKKSSDYFYASEMQEGGTNYKDE